MKGKVFIGWCGNSNIANEVKKGLESYDYEGKVGGASGSTTTLYLGQSIINDIDICNQAIFILQKGDKGRISANTLFEFGYALCRFQAKRIFAFYIDIKRNDKSIPSDIAGIWAEHYETKKDQVAEKIVEFFIQHQKTVVQENKMEIISSYYEKRHEFSMYESRPFCSEYELAQHVLFFSQAAYIMNDIVEGHACLHQLALSMKNGSEELEQALRFGQGYLKIFLNLSTEKGRMYLKQSDFFDAKEGFTRILNRVSEWTEENEFKTWFELLLFDMLNYVYVLRAACPGTPADRCDAFLKNSLQYAEQCLKRCDVLEKNDGDVQAVGLYRAYMYRNLATAYQKRSEPDETETIKYLQLSLEERKKLLDFYKIRSISSKIFESFEMEYYIAVSELLKYSEDRETLDENIDSCSAYLERIELLHKEKSHFIKRIEKIIEEVRTTWTEKN